MTSRRPTVRPAAHSLIPFPHSSAIRLQTNSDFTSSPLDIGGDDTRFFVRTTYRGELSRTLAGGDPTPDQTRVRASRAVGALPDTDGEVMSPESRRSLGHRSNGLRVHPWHIRDDRDDSRAPSDMLIE